MQLKYCAWLLVLTVFTAGCGRYMAKRMAQAPNSYPTWFAPAAPVLLVFDSAVLTNSSARLVTVGPPAAKLHYRVIEPGDFHLRYISTNWLERGKQNFRFEFHTRLPVIANKWTQSPRGTVVLLHGYGMAQFAMVPWALQLAQDGWRCVLVDLRGHGDSTGERIYFGLQETRDLTQLVDALAREQLLAPPLSVIGESYGAALALRWKPAEPRLHNVVAIAPYASLSNSTLNLSREYASWFPEALLRAGLKELPALLHVAPGELDTTTVLARTPVTALIVAGTLDKVMPLEDVHQVFRATHPGSTCVEVPGATHEAVPYFFDDLVPLVRGWIDQKDHADPGIKVE